MVNAVSPWGEGMWVSSKCVLTSCPEAFVDGTLVIAFITLVKIAQWSSVFPFISQPFLSQSEFGRRPNVMQAFFIWL